MRVQVLKMSWLMVCVCAATAAAQPVPVPPVADIATTVLTLQEPPLPPPQASQPRQGQQAPQPTPPVQPGRMQNPPPPMRLQGQPINVRIELTITDQTGTAPAVKKTVFMTVADEERGSIRSNAQIARPMPTLTQKEGPIGPPRIDNVPLSIDATPTVLSDNRIRLRLNLEYDVAGGVLSGAAAQGLMPGTVDNSQVRHSLGVVLTSGVPLVVAQSADAHSDRRVTLEVKATILK